MTFVRRASATPAGKALGDSAERQAALGELARDVAVSRRGQDSDPAHAAGEGAMGATIMEVDRAGQSMHPVLARRYRR